MRGGSLPSPEAVDCKVYMKRLYAAAFSCQPRGCFDLSPALCKREKRVVHESNFQSDAARRRGVSGRRARGAGAAAAPLRRFDVFQRRLSRARSASASRLSARAPHCPVVSGQVGLRTTGRAGRLVSASRRRRRGRFSLHHRSLLWSNDGGVVRQHEVLHRLNVGLLQRLEAV